MTPARVERRQGTRFGRCALRHAGKTLFETVVLRDMHSLRYVRRPHAVILAATFGTFVGACSAGGAVPSATPSVPPATTSPAPPSLTTEALQPDPDPANIGTDPVVSALTVAGVVQRCEEHTAAARTLASKLKALRGAPPDALRYETTLGRFDWISA